MRITRVPLPLAPLLATSLAHGEPAVVVRDLEALSPVTLTKDELQALLPNAKMGRTAANGNEHLWTNETGGRFIISTNNRARMGKPTTAPGTWQISDDGRYCVLIEWRGVDTEEWCRFIVKTSDGYYAARSTKTGTEKVYKLDISK
jgi:Protein of unknown function (DUF995)